MKSARLADVHATAGTELTAVGSVRISIAPHCSLNSRQARWFFVSVAAPCLLVATAVTTLLGFWPVLPFAGAEIAVFGWALHRSLGRRHQIEIITLTETQVLLERVAGQKSERHEFPRHWAQVKLRRSESLGLASRLTLESHGRSCEIGSFLTETERLGLARRLRQLVGRMAESPPLAANSGEPKTI